MTASLLTGRSASPEARSAYWTVRWPRAIFFSANSSNSRPDRDSSGVIRCGLTSYSRMKVRPDRSARRKRK